MFCNREQVLISEFKEIASIQIPRGWGLTKQVTLKGDKAKVSNGANLGFEAKMWIAADMLRS